MSSDSSDSAVRPGYIVWLMLLLGALTLAPLLTTLTPPLLDYPNHLARCYILAHLPTSPTLRLYYRNVMMAQPNLALDLIIPPMERVVSIWRAGQIFLAFTLLALVGGSIALHRAWSGHWSSWPALAWLLGYNRLFYFGFLGYLFGLGAALGACALWISLSNRPSLLRFASGLACASLIYLLHLYALGIYGVLVGGFELDDWLTHPRPPAARLARLAALAGQFLPAAFLFLWVSPTAGAVHRFAWGGFVHQLTEPLHMLDGVTPTLDRLTLAGLVTLVLLLLATGRATLAAPARIPLLLLGLLLLIMPNELFSSFGANRRIPIALACTVLAATDWHRISERLRRRILLGLCALIALRTGATILRWREDALIYRPYLTAFRALPTGATLLAAVPATPADTTPPLYHVDAYAVILRQVFLPSLFAAPDDAGSSVAFTPHFQALHRRTPPVVIWPPTLAALRQPDFAARHGPFRPALRHAYSDALVIDPSVLPRIAQAPARCTLIASGPDFRLLALPCNGFR